jgi:hypothetical protein
VLLVFFAGFVKLGGSSTRHRRHHDDDNEDSAIFAELQIPLKVNSTVNDLEDLGLTSSRSSSSDNAVKPHIAAERDVRAHSPIEAPSQNRPLVNNKRHLAAVPDDDVDDIEL